MVRRDPRVVLLTLAEKNNDLKPCLISALELNTGMMGFRVMNTSLDEVYLSLMRNVSGGSLRAQRDRQFDIWKATQDPAQVAKSNFDYCLRTAKIDLDLGPVGTTCFNLVGFPAMVELLKQGEFDRARTTTELRQAYGRELSVSFIDDTVRLVYEANAYKDGFKAHREVYAKCVKQTPETRETRETR